jgi:DNA-binding NtrC family response regulator
MSKDIEVMVIDDEPIVCERLQDYLEKKGIYVESFNESRRALERMEEKSFDVIVSDLKMDGPNGMDVLKAVKENSYHSEVILITGYGSFVDVRDAEVLGAYDFISKPFQMSEIFKLIRKAAQKAKKMPK